MGPSQCPSFEECEAPFEKQFNGNTYHIWNNHGNLYYRCTKTHRKLSHDVYEFYTSVKIEKGEVIHHKNGNTLDDSLGNLQKRLNGSHTILHHKGVPNPTISEWNKIHKKGNAYTKGRRYHRSDCVVCGLPTVAKDMCSHHYYKDYNDNRRAKL